MKLPKQLIIAGHKIPIRYRKRIVENGVKCWGLYDPNRQIIYLAYGMPDTQKMEIVLHEIIHAIEHIHVLPTSEKTVKTLGIEILAVIRNNKLNFLGGLKK